MASEPAAEDLVVGEPRWHMASAVLAAIVLTILMPDDLRFGPNWLLPVIVGVLLVAQIVGDPGRIDRRTAQLRALSVGLICVLVFSALWATAFLTSHLINGGKETNSAGALLEAGSIVWVSNIIAFALLYWELDGGGAAERAHRPSSRRVDFAFPQQMNPCPGAGALASPLHRLPVSGFHQRDRVQPDGRHAAGALGQDRHGRAGADLARRPRARDRPSGEHLRLAHPDKSPMMLMIARATPSIASPQAPNVLPCLTAHAFALSIAAGVSVGQILNASIGISSKRFCIEVEADHDQHDYERRIVQVDEAV